MDITIQPGLLSGSITPIPSKSQAHRALICAAFADKPTTLLCSQVNRDMEATADCLRALGADIRRTEEGYVINPGNQVPGTGVLPCRDSGSTLRFLLPVAGALGVDALFRLEGRLAQRPLSPLWEEMERMGCRLSRPSPDTIRCQGKLRSGEYIIDGGISSQFITGLLLACGLIPGASHVTLVGKVESKPYIAMTQQVMEIFGKPAWDLCISGELPYRSPGVMQIEGDWSNGAFFLTARALGSDLQVENLSPASLQGDRAVADILPKMDTFITLSAGDIPDLVPILAVAAACKAGAEFLYIQRLRLKESDRVESVVQMIRALGGRAEATDNTLTVYGTGLKGGTVDSVNDHRIAMAAAIAATQCISPVTILGAQCTDKSYPSFWAEFRRLGGNYEQHLR